MKVSDRVKTAYQQDSVTKHLSLYFPELDKEVSGTPIHQESMSLSECLVDSESIEFVGCIASKFKVNVQDLREDIKGKQVVVKIWTDGTEEEPVTLFNGIVDSAMKQSNKRIKEITAYDELYTRGNTEVAAWYKSLRFPITLKDLRDSLFAYIGLEQEAAVLPNDDVTIKKQYDPNTLQALAVIKAVCQINGTFGIINRAGRFEYRIMSEMYDNGTYPGPTLFPGPDTYLGGNTAIRNTELEQTGLQYYKEARFEEYEVKPVDRITIRQSEEDNGVTYGDGENNYIIQGNIFTYGLSKDVLLSAAENVYNSVHGFTYYPHETDNNGLPYVECGLNVANYMMIDYEATYSEENTSGEIIYMEKSFPVLNRTLSGIQALRDTYSARGEEYQTEFITDLQTQIDTIKKKQQTGSDVPLPDMEDYYDKETIDGMFENFEGGGGFNVESVASLPPDPDENTIYLIQGKVVVE